MNTVDERLHEEIDSINRRIHTTHIETQKVLRKIQSMDIEVDKYYDSDYIDRVITELKKHAERLTEEQENLQQCLLTKHSLNTVIYGDVYETMIYNQKMGFLE